MKTLIAILALAFPPTLSWAGNNAWNGPMGISGLRAGNDGLVTGPPVYTFSPVGQPVAAVPKCNDDVYVLRGSEYKTVYATLLMANLLGIQVNVFVNGCDAATGRPVVTDVQLLQ